MSLNQFLAVGRSIAGIRDEKSPFEMKKDCLLPRFDAAPRFAKTESAAEAGKNPVQADWLTEGKTPAPGKPAKVVEIVPAPALEPAAVARTEPAPARRGWLSILTFGILGKGRKGSRPLVQAELSLEKVRVLRNDLHDSDLEVVPKGGRPRARKAGAAARSWSTVDEEQPWTRLASRLFENGRR